MEGAASSIGLILGATLPGVVLGLLAHFTLFNRQNIWGTLIAGAAGSAIGRVLPMKPGWLWMLVGSFVALFVWWWLVLRKRSGAEPEPPPLTE